MGGVEGVDYEVMGRVCSGESIADSIEERRGGLEVMGRALDVGSVDWYIEVGWEEGKIISSKRTSLEI